MTIDNLSVEKKVAIVQSNYIPWKGYFDLMRSADEFVILDDVQFTRRDWRNRNLIKTQHGLLWLTIPIKSKGLQKINEVEISESGWHVSHWKTISRSLCRAPYFDRYESELHQSYLTAGVAQFLSQINLIFITLVARWLGIQTRITRSTDYPAPDERTQRLVSICKMAGANEYISGPTARAYLDEEFFKQAGITVRWFDYEGYPAYPQLFGNFEHRVTVLDLLLNTGPEALRYLVRDVKPEQS